MRIQQLPTPQLGGPANGGSVSMSPALGIGPKGDKGDQGNSITGPQGPPGPGTGAGAWQATAAYTANQVVQAPDGSMIRRVSTGTSRATFDATEKGLWTAVLATPGTIESDALISSYVGPTATPVGTLAWTDSGSTAVPFSVSPVDGKVYASTGWRTAQAIRTNDGFATTETGPDFATLGSAQPFLLYLGRVAERYVAIMGNGANALSGGAEIWTSASWSTGWAKVKDIGNTQGIAIGEPRVDPVGGNTVWVVGEYSQTAGGLHHVWVSQDGGQTWVDGGARAADDAANNNHIHGVCFDPATRRVYKSMGDGLNAYFGYSEDFGATWVDIPGAGIKPLNDPTFHQSVLNFPMPAGIVNNADASAGYSGVWLTDRIKHYTTQTIRLDNNVSGGSNQYADHPVARTDTSAYVVVPMRGTRTSNKWYAVATGDGGRTWHKVSDTAQASDEWFDFGVVGPDPAGRIYTHHRFGTSSTMTSQALLKANVLTWKQAPTQPVRAAGSNFLAALVAAGIVDPSVVPTLNLLGGLLTAGNLALDALNATITLGDGTNLAAINTKTGTNELRLQVGGVTVASIFSDKIQYAAGKHLTLNNGNISGVGTLTTTGGIQGGGGLTLLGSNAQITLGAGTGDVGVIDTKAGTGEIRLRITGTQIVSVTANELQFAEGKNLKFGTATGTMIGSAATQKLAFYGKTPIVQPASTPAAATDAATTQTLVNDIRTKLINLGLIA